MTQIFETRTTHTNAPLAASIIIQAGQRERSIRRSRRANRTAHRNRVA